ncbi:hypothetical protein Prum_071140 [Phytohabitans rumicis]|uniref:MalT-like TPR region domain-containing protein n=1 Tax=Phytohabitans rumicis TaxID=1076125 RepID=A0A6V8L883_9ACTN|nr:hypothetical protein Prum_071140 [Phytohabitans rumicis]
MDEHMHSLTQAREAYAARDWATAALRFDAVPTGQLAADDLADYADAVWWLGRIEDNLRLSAAACDAFLADSRPVEAAGAALVLGVLHLARGDEPQGMGWIGRAGHLLEGVPVCPVHGLLLHLTGVEPSLQAGQPAAAVDAARQVRDLGRRLGQPDLVAIGLNGEGRALIRSGHVIDGLRLLDEAMIAVLDGELAPFVSGTLYCHTITACHEVVDVRRMARWTDLAERWLATFPAAVAFGVCARCTGLSSTSSTAGGTTPSAQRCRSCRTSMPTGSTMPPRHGTSWPRRAGCAATRAPQAPTTRRTPVGATRSRVGPCCSSWVATPREPRRPCAPP